jgi:hypothetical protein
MKAHRKQILLLMETFSLGVQPVGMECKPETPAKKVFKSVDGGKKSKGDAEVEIILTN